MADTVAAVSMAATVTSSMSAAMASSAAVTAALGYRAARHRHRNDKECNSN